MMLQNAMMRVAWYMNVMRLLHRAVVEDGVAAESVPRELLQALERGRVQVVNMSDVVQLMWMVGKNNKSTRPFWCLVSYFVQIGPERGS